MSGKDLDFKKPSFESHEDNPDLYLEWHNPCSSHLHSSESELDITDCSFSTASSANITSIDTPINTSLKSKASISDCRIRKVKYKTGFNVFFGNEPHTMKITGPTETNIPVTYFIFHYNNGLDKVVSNRYSCRIIITAIFIVPPIYFFPF